MAAAAGHTAAEPGAVRRLRCLRRGHRASWRLHSRIGAYAPGLRRLSAVLGLPDRLRGPGPSGLYGLRRLPLHAHNPQPAAAGNTDRVLHMPRLPHSHHRGLRGQRRPGRSPALHRILRRNNGLHAALRPLRAADEGPLDNHGGPFPGCGRCGLLRRGGSEGTGRRAAGRRRRDRGDPRAGSFRGDGGLHHHRSRHRVRAAFPRRHHRPRLGDGRFPGPKAWMAPGESAERRQRRLAASPGAAAPQGGCDRPPVGGFHRSGAGLAR